MIEKETSDRITDKYIQCIYESEHFTLNKYFDIEEIFSLFSYSQIISYISGKIILKQGKKSEGIFIVLEGTVNIIERTLGKNKFHLGILEPGEFLGVTSYISNESSPTSFIANDNVTCLFISKTYLNMVALVFPEINYKILKAITNQVCLHLINLNKKVNDYIANSGMSRLSLYGRVVHSMTKPSILQTDDLEKYKELLKKFDHYFNEDEWNYLFKQCQFLDAPKNCKIISENETSYSCYIVIRGAVQSSIMKDNKLAKLSVIGPYTLLANVPLENHPFTVTFITCESAILLKMNEINLKFIEKNQTQLWYKLYNLICKSVVALQKSIDKLDSRLQVENYNR